MQSDSHVFALFDEPVEKKMQSIGKMSEPSFRRLAFLFLALS